MAPVTVADTVVAAIITVAGWYGTEVSERILCRCKPFIIVTGPVATAAVAAVEQVVLGVKF